MLFTGLVVEIFDAPFCRVLMASSARVVQSRSPLRRPEAGRRRRSSSSPVPMAAGETRRRSNVHNRRHCLGSMGEGSRIPGTASWSSSLANLGCCVSPVPNAGFCHVLLGSEGGPLLHDVNKRGIGIAFGKGFRDQHPGIGIRGRWENAKTWSRGGRGLVAKQHLHFSVQTRGESQQVMNWRRPADVCLVLPGFFFPFKRSRQGPEWYLARWQAAEAGTHREPTAGIHSGARFTFPISVQR